MWPRDNQDDLIRFYGDPGNGAIAPNLVKVIPPFRMTYEGTPVPHLLFHRLAAPALERALKTVWEYYGRDQSKIDALGISKTAGTYDHRTIRGSDTKWSNHAYGAAIDINAEENGFNVEGNIPIPMIAAFKAEGARWGGDYRGRTDPMHFELCQSGEPVRTFEQWLAFYGATQQPTGVRMPSNFDRVHPLIAKWEGGYSNDPADAGGPTNFGITQDRLSESRGRPVSAAEVQALQYSEALEIFKRYYWTPLRCDELPLALATMTYNAGVNSGPSKGARFLQQAINQQGLGLDEDGEIGPLTLEAARRADTARVVRDYAAIYEAYYRSLPNFSRFGAGWLNRLNDITPQALAWVNEPLPPLNGEVLPPIREKDMETEKTVAAVIAALEARGVIPKLPEPQAPPVLGFDITQLMPLLLQTAVGQKLIGGQAVTLLELLPLIQHFMGGRAVPALPAPSPVVPLLPPLAPPPAAPPPAVDPTVKPVVGTSALALTIGSILQTLGVVGTPFGIGENPTATGTLTTLIPLIAGVAGAFGGFGPLLSIFSGLFGGRK